MTHNRFVPLQWPPDIMVQLPLKQAWSKLARWASLEPVPAPYRVVIAGAALVVVLMFNMWIALQSAQNVFDDQETLRRGLIDQQRIDAMLSYAKDMEAGVRGYFIAGDPQFLDPYQRGSQRLQQQMAQLAAAPGADAAATALMNRFRADLGGFLEQSRDFVEQRRQMRDEASVEALQPLVQAQKQRMDALRDSAAAISAYQRLANSTLDAAIGQARRSARISILVPSIISVMLVAFLCHLVLRHLRQRGALELQGRLLLEKERAARAEAEAASQAKDEFVSTVSHELRTPLQAILGWSQVLERLVRGRDSAPTAQLGTQLQTIERNARSLAHMIDDLLDVSRAITGKLTLVTQRVDLADILQAAVEVARPAAIAKGVQLALELRDVPLWMIGDADRLRQVVINLVGNAVKFTPGGGDIQVGARRLGARLEVKVRDSGIGIVPELLPRIFERYVQGSVSSARQYGGLGLGLAIVKHLVEMHGGQVGVHSAGSGRGAEFTLNFPVQALQPLGGETSQHAASPLAEAPSGPDPAGPSRTRRLAGLRLLVVDDDADVLHVLESLLAEEGARVVPAASAAEAMERLRFQRMDLVLSDIGMPGTDGYELARRIRALSERESVTPSGVPLIALTAFSRAEDAQRSLEAGFNQHLTKPVDMDKLIAALSLHARAPASPPIEVSAAGSRIG